MKRYAIVDGVKRELTESEIIAFSEVPAHVEQLEKPTKNRTVHITREDFNLLDATASDTVYYIIENDGSVTMRKGDNA